MAVRPKLMIGASIAIAGLGLIGAGAGATFTAQVSADTTISSGGLGLSLNGETGSDVDLEVDGKNISSHFTPISKDLRLKNTGTLDMASHFLNVTATGCDGEKGAPLAKALHVRLTDETNHDLVYDGPLCSLVRLVSRDTVSARNATVTKAAGKDASDMDAPAAKPKNGHGAASKDGPGFTVPATHSDSGGQLPNALRSGKAIHYRLVIRPEDAVDGLPPEAQFTRTSVKLVFTGFDY